MTRPLAPTVFVALLAAPLVLLGCARSSETIDPPVRAPATFSSSGDAAAPDRWWTAFDSDTLTAVVDRALASNFTLKTAWQRLRAANAVADRASAALFPALDGSAQGSVTRSSSEDAARDGDGQSEQFQLGLTATYEVDLWGRIRASADAERLRAEASRTDVQTAALSVAAQIVRTWARLAEARNQVDLVTAQIETNTQVLQLLENRFGTGQIRSVDLLRQRQLLESTREQLPLAEARVRVLEHQLAVLLGRPPQAGAPAQPEALPALPPLPATGVPTDLVRRRPDVQSALLRLRAADRDLAAAISSQYPRLTLTASASTAAESARTLFQDWITAFAGDLFAPIFAGGELRAEVDRTEAVRQQRLYEYGQTILVAFQEVEDALIREQKQRASLEHLNEQIDLAQQAYDQLRVQYLNGAANYLDVLTALDEVQQLRRDRLAAELLLVEDRIALYQALAGAVDAPPPPMDD